MQSNFIPSEENSLLEPNIVLRDSLGFLAIQILSSREDISKMDYNEMLCKLHKIICELHETYHKMNNYFGD